MIPSGGRSVHHWYCPVRPLILYFKTVADFFSMRTSIDLSIFAHSSRLIL